MRKSSEKSIEKKHPSFTQKSVINNAEASPLLQVQNNRPEAAQLKKLQQLANEFTNKQHPIQKKKNNTGLPDNLKTGIENLSGYSMDDVKVHYNSNKPVQLQAHAYAQGTNIHLASGQEKHLPHEAWHVVQQKQGRVKPTLQMKGKVNVNDDAGLEKEADIMGAKALQLKANKTTVPNSYPMVNTKTIQRAWIATGAPGTEKWDAIYQGLTVYCNRALDKYFIRITKPEEVPQERKVFFKDYSEQWLTKAEYDNLFSATASGTHVIAGEYESDKYVSELKRLRLLYNNNPTLKNLDAQIKQIKSTVAQIEDYHIKNGAINYFFLIASLKRVLVETLSKRNLMVHKATTIGDAAGHGLVNLQKMIIAQQAIEYSKSRITHGPQNQVWARTKYGDEGDVNMAAMVNLTNAHWGAKGGYNHVWTNPRKIGAAVEATGGGNCQDIAALTYNYLREHCQPSWTICFVVNETAKHSFATIGNPTTTDPNNVIVADAWVQFPRAVTLENHFCKNGTLRILRAKQGTKVGRTANLMSKYWVLAPLPTYINNLKTGIRLQPTRGAASWNNNFPEGG